MDTAAEYITSQTLASRLKVTAETVRVWVRRGWIPCLRAGKRPILFDPVEVERALKARGGLRGARERLPAATDS